MGIIAKDGGGGDFEPVPEGQHIATCVLVADIGTQESNNPNYAPQRKVVIGFEIPSLMMVFDDEKGEEPRMISSTYTLSLGDKAYLKRDLQTWRGKAFTPEELDGFDLEKLAGVPATIQVIHAQRDGKTYANINSITPVPKGNAPPEIFNPVRLYSVGDHSQARYDELPDWIKAKIDAQQGTGRGQGDGGRTPPATGGRRRRNPILEKNEITRILFLCWTAPGQCPRCSPRSGRATTSL